jgi:hypothetical protein
VSPQTLRSIRRLEGQHVSVCLCDGTRLDDCQLVSAGRGGSTLWLVDAGEDRFVSVDDVVDLFEVA